MSSSSNPIVRTIQCIQNWISNHRYYFIRYQQQSERLNISNDSLPVGDVYLRNTTQKKCTPTIPQIGTCVTITDETILTCFTTTTTIVHLQSSVPSPHPSCKILTSTRDFQLTLLSRPSTPKHVKSTNFLTLTSPSSSSRKLATLSISPVTPCTAVCTNLISPRNIAKFNLPPSLSPTSNIQRHHQPYISQLYIYPIHDTGGMEVAHAYVTPYGLQYDTNRILRLHIAHDMRTLTANTCPQLRRICVQALPGGDIQLSVRFNASRFIIFTPVCTTNDMIKDNLVGRGIRICKLRNIGGDEAEGIDQGDLLGEFLSNTLGLSNARLVQLMKDEKKGIAVIAKRSTMQLQEWSKKQIDIRRFQPSIIVQDTLQPFEENDWARLSVTNRRIKFEVYEACKVDKTITVDMNTGEYDVDGEPLNTLWRYRRVLNEVTFGVIAEIDMASFNSLAAERVKQEHNDFGVGLIRVGDQLSAETLQRVLQK